MPLGTLDRTPPPFFRQGPSALSKLVFFAALALFLMVADARFRITEPLRATLAIALLPVQRTLAVPVELAVGGTDYLRGLQAALDAERAAQQRLAQVAERAARTEQLAQENARLRALLELRPALVVASTPAEVLYAAGDPFSRKVIIDRGTQHGLKAGSPAINEAGVLGQVTRVFALTAEVTLLSDRDASIPVINTRTLQRSAAFGAGAVGSGGMELRYLSGNADVEVGDTLHTSGLDGVYPPGLPVARVASVERRGDSGFARIGLAPVAALDGVRHLLVLQPLAAQLPPPPEPEAAEPRPRRQSVGPGRAEPPTPP